jgi:hypothetical protein
LNIMVRLASNLGISLPSRDEPRQPREGATAGLYRGTRPI